MTDNQIFVKKCSNSAILLYQSSLKSKNFVNFRETPFLPQLSNKQRLFLYQRLVRDEKLKPGFHLDIFCLSLLVLVFRTNKKPQRAMRCSNGNIHKNQNEQQKAITSNKRHLPVLVFEIELILSQKQERATKSSKRQRTANGNTHQKPKRATKSNKEHFSFPFSFIRTSSGPVEGGLYQEQ